MTADSVHTPTQTPPDNLPETGQTVNSPVPPQTPQTPETPQTPQTPDGSPADPPPADPPPADPPVSTGTGSRPDLAAVPAGLLIPRHDADAINRSLAALATGAARLT